MIQSKGRVPRPDQRARHAQLQARHDGAHRCAHGEPFETRRGRWVTECPGCGRRLDAARPR